jgi:cyclohexyl-isocyanide hydratase
MPHIQGSVPKDAARVIELDGVEAHPEEVTGTRIGFAAFEGLTLLDLVGPLDSLSRIATMGFDASTSCEVFALTPQPVWSAARSELRVERYRPPLEDFDVLVLPGGLGTRSLERDSAAVEYLRTYPANRFVASVCTGAILVGAMGRLRGKRATTHHSELDELSRFGATAVVERVVDEGQVVTAGGVTCGLDLGLHLVARLSGAEVAEKIARQMEMPRRGFGSGSTPSS